MKLKRDTKFGKESTCRFKIYIQIWEILTWAREESLKNFHFNGLLISKVCIVSVKKYRGVIFHETEEGYKIWRGIDLFQNWHFPFFKAIRSDFWSGKPSKLKKIIFLALILCFHYSLLQQTLRPLGSDDIT